MIFDWNDNRWGATNGQELAPVMVWVSFGSPTVGHTVGTGKQFMGEIQQIGDASLMTSSMGVE